MEYKEINIIQEVLWTIKEIKQLSLAGDKNAELLNTLPRFCL